MSQRPFDYWEYVIADMREHGVPLYEQFALGISTDEGLKQFANMARQGQPPANILFAAVHYLLLRGADGPLRRFYPNLNGGKRVDDLDGAFPAFKSFVDAHRKELAPIVRSRVTNTNEVGRSAVLHAAFRALALEAGEPLHLIELGPSAGANLLWDRYGVRYRRNGESFHIGDADANLVLDIELRGETLPPLGANPRVASRVGLERHRVDLSRSEERDWLKALIWADEIERFARLDSALAILTREDPPIREGDALALLPDVLAEIPAGETACVYHSFVVYQFPREKRAALNDLLVAASLRRPVWRLSWEGRLTGEGPPLLHAYRDGVRTTRLLAQAESHGAWMEWQA